MDTEKRPDEHSGSSHDYAAIDKSSVVREAKRVLRLHKMERFLEAFWRQEQANEDERKGMQERHFYEWQEMNRRHEHADNPFRVALGDHYCRENVEDLAKLVRQERDASKSA